MKKLLVVLICLITISAIAQNRKIEFKETIWKKNLENAKKQNKLIFFDAYTSWCGPCKMMAKDVFTKDSVADLFNQSFINVKYDMEKGEGISLKETYGVAAYPTYLFINGDGEIVHKIVGSMSPNEFINEANNALNPENTIYGLAKKFESTGHSQESAIAYLDALDKAYESEKKSVISKIYFDELPEATLLEEENWNLVQKYLNNPSSKAFAYLYVNRIKLAEKYNSKVVNNYFKNIFYSSVYMIKSSYNKKTNLKEAKENGKAIREILDEPNEYSKIILAKLDLIEFAGTNQWNKFSEKVDLICADDNFSKTSGEKNYVVIEAGNDVATANQKDYYKNALKWAYIIDNNNPNPFTKIQLAELKKRLLIRQGKTLEAENMFKKEQALRKEAAEKGQITPPIMKN